ncbi:hypothetical protein [Paenibacillus sp. GCM10027626]|uniref:YkvI family membrane protein n=1 Tax=Paenibacillus sp. GCM10027626 TaxID=3273411 RepID=UPI0036302700
MNKKTVKIGQIAVIYMGTVVGAGFASGQSIMQFFTLYGAFGGAGILLTTLLFMWFGTRLMVLSHRIKAFSYQDLNNYLFGKFFGKVANILTFFILLGVTAVMLSGTGSIFAEQLGLPYQLGIVISIVLSFLVMTKEIHGILAVNALVVPLMLFFTCIIAFDVVDMESITRTTDWQERQLTQWNWLVSPITYAALNFAFVQAVMVPLASETEDERVLKWGGFWGGIGLGFMLLISHFSINSKMPGILQFDIPMAEIIRGAGSFLYGVFIMVIFGEIFTTLVGNIFGIARQIRSVYPLPTNWVVLATLLICFAISQAGFTSLLTYLYPLFGYTGMIFLAFLAFKRLPA